jgi:hypothetical protein
MTDNLKGIAPTPKAWHEGYDAGRRWLPRKNPYSTESDDALAWVSGYIEGKTKPSRAAKP